jgi:hypothetical protein
MTAVMTGTGIALSFQGRFKFGIDQWAYVPFQVPAGVQRIEVSTSHDQFSLLGIGRNVLDLGIFGPAGYELGNAAGFRGWSGGARAGFTLSAINATPGYLAGPIDPGQWTLALGPVVLNPLGMDWQAQIVLTRGVQPSLRDVPAARPAVRRRRQAGWYRGDLHTHTVHSDGRRRIEEMAEAATSADLDFIVSTDHNTSSANRAWAASSTGKLEVVAGRRRDGVSSRVMPPRFARTAAWWWPHIFGAVAGLRMGVRLPRRRCHGDLERPVECRRRTVAAHLASATASGPQDRRGRR